MPALPWVSAFPELNVRTYVRVAGKPGVFFFSLDAGNPLAVGAAQTLFNLPYYSADDEGRRPGDDVAYSSRRRRNRAPSSRPPTAASATATRRGAARWSTS